MSWWRICGLAVVVAAVHLWVIQAIEALSGREEGSRAGVSKVVTAKASFTLVEPHQAALPVPLFPPGAIKAPLLPVQIASSPPQPQVSGLDGEQKVPLRPEDFLDPDQVDDPADSPEDFGTILQSTLSPIPGTIDIELWIDGNGNVLNAFCVGIECTDALAADARRLIGLVFRPAKKNGAPVASRKIIRVEPLPAPSF